MTLPPLSAGPDAVLIGLLQAPFQAAPPARIGIAVSGGGDSMALLHLAMGARLGWTVAAVTVDHGLRAASAQEAAGVAAFCAAAGISHHILRWQGPSPSGNLMDQARRARFALIADWARSQDIGHVLLGHTADDNAESFLMNLARQAGLDGLCGMRSMWQDRGLVWHRPLLSISRADLRAYLGRKGVAWIDDPSNDNDRFTRIKARRALQALAPLGITPQRLHATLSNLSTAQHALNLVTARAATVCVREHSGGLVVSAQDLAQIEGEIARRLLSAIIRWMGGAGYGPRGTQLTALQTALATGKAAQLGGVMFRPAGPRIEVTREPRAAMGPVPLGQRWDHRWVVSGPASPGYEIRALGAKGLGQCPEWRAHGKRSVLVVSPAVWDADRLIAAPLAGNSGQYGAELTQGLTEFILSH